MAVSVTRLENRSDREKQSTSVVSKKLLMQYDTEIIIKINF